MKSFGSVGLERPAWVGSSKKINSADEGGDFFRALAYILPSILALIIGE